MEFTRRGPTVDEDIDCGHCFPDHPPPHGDAMPVIRDALLSQLQRDRHRQEIIMAEIAKIDRAMALHSTSHHDHGIASSSAERATPVSFISNEQFMPHYRGAVGSECNIGVDDVHWGVELKSEKPAMEDTIHESNENTLPKKTSYSVKWSCAICQVEATSEGNLLQHFAGLKHRSNAIALKAKAKAKAEKSTKARQYAEEPRPTWVCRFCQANCTCKSDLENHLKSNRHDRKIQALLEESKRMARNSVSWEVDSHPNIVPQDEGKPVSSVWICIICQVKCTSQSIMDSHLKGKKHQINVQALQLEAKRVGNTSPQIAKNQQPPKEWDCRSLGHRQKLEAGMNAQPAEKDRPEPMEARWTCWLCLAKCTCAADYHNHLIGRRHRENTEALRADPGKTAADLKSAYYCALCDVQCSGEKQMASHLGGRRHREMLEDPDTE